jgi:Leucine rich repeat
VILNTVPRGSASTSCQWNELNPTQNHLDVTSCVSPTIDSIFLGRTSNESADYSKLKTLRIQTSLIEIEMERFTRASNLKTLDLSNNKIQRIHEKAFNGLHGLKNLKMDRNELESLHINVFADLPNLEYLSVDQNQLVTFDFSIVERNHKLIHLEISRNAITRVMTSKQFSTDLQSINLKTNYLRALSMEDLPQVPVLKLLYIDNNNLTKFNFDSVKDKFSKLQVFHFGSNHFDCWYLLDMVTALMRHMPTLLIDWENANDLKDTKTFQNLSKCVTSAACVTCVTCVTCANPVIKIRKFDDLEEVIRYKEKIIHFLSVALVLVLVGSLYYCYSKRSN